MYELILYNCVAWQNLLKDHGIVIVGQSKIIYKVLGIDEKWAWWM
jgi:hypothetical protein